MPSTCSLPKPQDNFVTLTSMFAVSAGSIGVDLQDIPNEPIRFLVRLFYWFCCICSWKWIIRRIPPIEVVVKMLLLHGHGRHLLKILMIRMCFFVCQWRKYRERLFGELKIFLSSIIGIGSCYGCCPTICPIDRRYCSTEIHDRWSFKSKEIFFAFLCVILLNLFASSEDGPVSDSDCCTFRIKQYLVYSSAWTTAAVDNERVIGAVPIVMDILNIHQVRHPWIEFLPLKIPFLL